MNIIDNSQECLKGGSRYIVFLNETKKIHIGISTKDFTPLGTFIFYSLEDLIIQVYHLVTDKNVYNVNFESIQETIEKECPELVL